MFIFNEESPSFLFREVPKYADPPKPAASRESLGEFFNLLKQSQKPLVIVGKGNYSYIYIYILYVLLILRLFFWFCGE